MIQMNKTETVLQLWKTNLWVWKETHGGGIIQELGMNIYTLQEGSPGGGHGKTQSSILPWKIPWTEKPGRLQYIGSQRVRQDWVTSLSLSLWGIKYLFNWETTCNAEDADSVPGSGRFPGEENGNLLQYSSLGNPMDRGAWQATVQGIAKSRTQLSD